MKPTQIAAGIEAVDLSLYLPSSKTLIFADFHIGFEESLESQGVLVPRFQLKDSLARLEKIFDAINASACLRPTSLKASWGYRSLSCKRPTCFLGSFSPPRFQKGAEKEVVRERDRRQAVEKCIKTIVINGDLKHEFGEISRQEWNDCLALIDFLATKCEQIVLVKGNHDTILGPIARKRNLKGVDSYIVDNKEAGKVFITHGHKLPEKALAKNIKTIIIGHEHPAITLAEAAKTEKYKCFLKGSWKCRVLVAQPSFNLITEGTDAAKQKLLSPFLQKGVSDFEVFVVDEKKHEVLYFGKLKDSPSI